MNRLPMIRFSSLLLILAIACLSQQRLAALAASAVNPDRTLNNLVNNQAVGTATFHGFNNQGTSSGTFSQNRVSGSAPHGDVGDDEG